MSVFEDIKTGLSQAIEYEKQNADNEIVKELEKEYQYYQDCANAQMWGDYFDEELLKKAADLINRLQSEIAGYVVDQEIWISGYQGTQAENEQLKAEIERLTEERKTANMHDLMYWFNAYKECAEDCEKYVIEASDTKAENIRLQKQVDELTEKKEISIENIEKELANYLFMSCSYGALVCGKMSLSIAQEQAKGFAPFVYGFLRQAVKDTAKEYYQKMQVALGILCFGNDKIHKENKEIARQFGVEVE